MSETLEDKIARAKALGATDEKIYRKPNAHGARVVLGDGNEWIVPTLQFLPKKPKMTTDADGKIKVEVHVAEGIERGIDVLAEAYMDGKINKISVEWEALFEMMYESLKVNYPDLTPEAVTKMGLLSSEIFPDFIQAMTGVKKNSPPASGSESISDSPVSIPTV